MSAEITTERISTKWHGYLDGRPDVDETALTEDAARRKVERLRDRVGTCGARLNRDGSQTCELVSGHCVAGGRATSHRSGALAWD